MSFINHNGSKLVGWIAFGIAAGCFFGAVGVGVVASLLVLIQLFGK